MYHSNCYTIETYLAYYVPLNKCILQYYILCPFFFNPLKTDWALPYYKLEESIFDFRYVKLYDVDIPKEKKVELFANSADPDQTPRSVASDLGLHCLPVTRLKVSSL